MYTKLTLNITDTVVEKAKRAARKRKTSVSRMVEEYLEKISADDQQSVVQSIIANAPAKKQSQEQKKV